MLLLYIVMKRDDRLVRVTNQFDPAQTVLVPQRWLDGQRHALLRWMVSRTVTRWRLAPRARRVKRSKNVE